MRVSDRDITKRIRRLNTGVLVCATLATVSCGSEPIEPNPDPKSATIEIVVSRTLLTSINEEIIATATIRDSLGFEVDAPRLTWSSSNSRVLTVAPTGMARATGNGEAFLTATTEGVRDSISVTVAQKTTTLEIESGQDTLWLVGIRHRVTLIPQDSLGSPVAESMFNPTWSVSDDSVAIIDSDGFLVPNSSGRVVITASSDRISASATKVVSPQFNVSMNLPLAERLQWALEDSTPTDNRLGFTAAVIMPDGTEWLGATGWSAQGKQLRPGAVIALGSIAKMVAGALLVDVVDDGLVSLDDTLGQWLPPFNNVAPDATMRHILNNSSGILNYGVHPNLGNDVAADPFRLWTTSELVANYVGTPEFAPGTRYKSSNTGFLLASLIIEAATGGTYESELRDRFLNPLNLNEFFYFPPVGPAPTSWETGWWLDPNGTRVDFTPFLTTSRWSARSIGALMASSIGLARFTHWFLGGSAFSPDVTNEMLTAIPDDGLIPGQNGAGLALRRYGYLGRTQWGHSGVTSNGSGMVVHDVQSGITVAFLLNTNNYNSAQFQMVPLLLQMALQSL